MFYYADMDNNAVIERWRVPLLGIILELFARIGLSEGATIERLSKPLHRLILSRLRTAESAVRRLLITAARDIVVEPRLERPVAVRKPSTKDKDKSSVEGKPRRKRRPLFNLFDALKRQVRIFKKKRRKFNPRITSF